MTINVRQACLDDTQAISALFRAHVNVWQRLNQRGQVEDVDYPALTIHERWLHGGPWMSVETGAIQLSHLLRGAGIALVAELDGRVCAYAEAYHNVEPPPFGDNVSLAHLTAAEGGEEARNALLNILLEQTKTLKSQRLTVSRVADDAALSPSYPLTSLARLQRYILPARTGQVFYKAVDHPNPDPARINGWFMSLGRIAGARQQWETLWPSLWDAIPEMRQQRTHRLHFSAGGQEALVCCQQQRYDPRSADIYCWSPKPVSTQNLTAIRDWAHREGYRSLWMMVTEETAKTLGPDAEPDAYTQDICSVTAV